MIRFIWLVMTVIISLPAHQNICLSSSENGIWNEFSVNSCMVTYELFFQLKLCQWVMLSCNGTCLPCFIVQYQKLAIIINIVFLLLLSLNLFAILKIQILMLIVDFVELFNLFVRLCSIDCLLCLLFVWLVIFL